MNLTENEVSGILTSISTRFTDKIRHKHLSEEKSGYYLVPLFLDTILPESTALVVRREFIIAMDEAITRLKESKNDRRS